MSFAYRVLLETFWEPQWANGWVPAHIKSTLRGSVKVRSKATEAARSSIASAVVWHTWETTSTVFNKSSWRIDGCSEPSGLKESRIVWATWRKSPESASTKASSHSTPRDERLEDAKGIPTAPHLCKEDG